MSLRSTPSTVHDDIAVVEDGPVTHRVSKLGIATVVSLVALAYAAFFFAPEDYTGPVQRIFYIHVPSAWISFLAFGIVFGYSIAYLRTRNPRYDEIAAASAQVGVLFCTVVLVTGMMWGHAIWGVYWTWEPRLTSFLVLWLLYLSYLALRSYVPDPSKRARFSAVVGIVAFLDVPIVYMSVQWWRTVHPEQIIAVAGGPKMPMTMVAALLVGLTAMTLVFSYLLRLRLQVTRLAAHLEEIQS